MTTNLLSLSLGALVRLGRHRAVLGLQAVTLLGCALLGSLELAGVHTGAPTEEMLAARRVQAQHAQSVADRCYRRIEQGDAAGALPICREAVRLAPSSARAQKNLGLALHRTGKPAEAALVLETAVQLSPGMDEAQYLLGNLYQASGDSVMSIHSYREAIEANPSHFRAHYGLARAYESSGQDTKAIEEWKAVVRLRPDYLPTYRYLIPQLRYYGRLNEAKEMEKRQHSH